MTATRHNQAKQSFDGGMQLATAAGAARSLRSDAEGNASWVPVDIQVITSDKAKWKKPANCRFVVVICIGAGGGGGGGAHGKSGTICTGGGAGGGACVTEWRFAASELESEVEVRVNTTVNTGGIGFTTEKAGEAGKAGASTKFGTLLEAAGGNAGKGGEITGVAAKGGTEKLEGGQFLGNTGGECAATGKASAGKGNATGCAGGGGGGGTTITPTAESGGAGGATSWQPANGAAGGTASSTTAVGEAGKPGIEPGKEQGIPGGGGGGGGASKEGEGGAGGKGGAYGGGGGGGGTAIATSKLSGSGGEGGKGACIVVSY